MRMQKQKSSSKSRSFSIPQLLVFEKLDAFRTSSRSTGGDSSWTAACPGRSQDLDSHGWTCLNCIADPRNPTDSPAAAPTDVT